MNLAPRGLFGALLLWPYVATAQTEQRPTEDELFGGSGATTPSPQTGSPNPGQDASPSQPPAAQAAEEVRASKPEEQGKPEDADANADAERLRSGLIQDQFASGEQLDNPLQIGGLFYQRLLIQKLDRTPPSGAAFSVPTLVDGYLDARPGDRVRAFLLTRLRYDPTRPPPATTSTGDGEGQSSDDQASSAASSDSATQGSGTAALLGGSAPNPSVALDQLWIRFDIARTVFVTAGKQHVKWGTGRFWNPTDYLHPQRRDPLALFDARTGANMVKFHLPIESNGWNFYTFALFDEVGSDFKLGNVGGAARAELVFGSAELGLDAVVQRGQRPQYGADLSTSLGPVDVYGEVSLRPGAVTRWRRTETPDITRGIAGLFEQYEAAPRYIGATGGLTYTFVYGDNDTLTLGGEYFYNTGGYTDPALYPALLFAGEFQPFYLGRHYAGVYALLLAPGSWDKTSFILSNLANVSDKSVVTRLDFTVRVLTHLTVEAYVAGHYGGKGGEFRFQLDIPPFELDGRSFPGRVQRAPELDVGVALRVDL